ncbi:MAG: 16S rRNA (cytidine(1402)-2'-O)-methyltransferase [Candidatus Melainabacteria bacterium HGW-Melainabacteria-1]|nr:MAG: 16S rRNA (cytidine(1402)-2'-O)-methyltransferase [Candidatus Melainabacteria bacterium HGW-Melainabacteria-1]
MPGTLYLCATPIGHLKDITLRCLETLKSVDLILAEDTRQTRKLLSHYQISVPMKSFHAHNEQGRVQDVVNWLLGGQSIALVSDAGLPLISDPGAGLVRAVQDAGVVVTCIPGPSAPATALLLSGIAPMPYVFLGFLPRQGKARRESLRTWLGRSETLVLFEAPHRLVEALTDLVEVFGPREASVCRELTKIHEEIRRAPLDQLLAHYRSESPRGEITLVIAGGEALPAEAAVVVSDAELQAAYAALQAEGLKRKEIFQTLQQRYGLSRNSLYSRLLDS